MGSDPWRAEYQRRAGALMDLFEPAGVALIWVGMPDMRDERMAAAMVAMTRAVEAAAGLRPWVTFVDTRPMFRGPEGGFSAFLPSPDGEPVKMRGDDGIHLTRPGTNLVAEVVYAHLTRGWDLRTPTPTRTATATPTPAPTRTATATASPAPSRTASATRSASATTAPTPQAPGSAELAARATVAPGP